MSLPGLVDIVDELLDDSCCIGGLDVIGMVSHNDAGYGPDNNSTSFPLEQRKKKKKKKK